MQATSAEWVYELGAVREVISARTEII